MDNINLNLIKEDCRELVLNLLEYLKKHSKETYLHSIDVAEKAYVLATSLGVKKEDLKTLYTASLLHDIGKLCVAEDLLHKKNATENEINVIRASHIEGTTAILSDYFHSDIVNLAAHHHERLNSSGYPEHLGAKKLNILDRILQVADVTSALEMHRSYKNPYSQEQIVEILDGLVSHGELDPKCVEEIKRIVLDPLIAQVQKDV